MELKEGMYVRTIKGIDKVLLVEYAEEKKQKYPNHPSKKYWRDKIYLSKERYWRTSQNIIKASNNIIDLIEVGDYVNGYKADFVQNNEIVYNHNHPRQLNMFAKDIKSIVTKEQFESMQYKVGE